MSILDDVMGEYGFAVPKAAYDKLQEHIAARQPVGQEPVKASSQPAVVPYQRAHALLGDAYNAGTQGVGFGDQAEALFDLMIAAPPTQAVNLGQLPRYSKSYSEGIYLDDAGDWVRFADVLALIDSKAMGNG